MIRYDELPYDVRSCLRNPALAATRWLRAHPESDRSHASVTSRMTVLQTRIDDDYAEGGE